MDWLLNIKAFIFDLDGTLIDSEKAHLKAWSEALSVFLQDFDINLVQKHFGKSGREIAFLILQDEMKAEQCEKIKDQIFDTLLSTDVEPMPCAISLLELLKRRNIKTGVASSHYSERIIRILKHFNMLDFFDIIVGLDEVTKPKPSPELLLKALRKLDVSPAVAAYIGDSPYDVLTALNAGCYSILIKTYPRVNLRESRVFPNLVVKSLCELYREIRLYI
jgi:HAD superfamily hydrolase (TIGR01509 family)